MGHTNIQVTTTELNMKLKLEADKALVLKMFENKFPALFGRPVGDSGAIKMITLTKDTWLPGSASFEQWETSNKLGK
eukprot:9613972-Ditylum_brightwellii.AAC.1